GAPGELLAAAKGFGGGVADEAAVDRARCGRLAVDEVEDEGAAVGARRFPLVPMAYETRAILVEAAAAGAGERTLVLGIAAEARAFLGDIAPGEEAGSVGRQLEARDVGLLACDLARLGARGGRIDAPHLALARCIGDEE